MSDKSADCIVSENSTHALKICIADDDRITSIIVKARILQQFPHCHVYLTHEPVIIPGCQVYIIDNNFNGEDFAVTLIETINQVSPDALVIAMSNTLSVTTLEQLMNKGCSAVYNKIDPDQLTGILNVMGEYILSFTEGGDTSLDANTLHNIVTSLKVLMEQWYERLR